MCEQCRQIIANWSALYLVQIWLTSFNFNIYSTINCELVCTVHKRLHTLRMFVSNHPFERMAQLWLWVTHATGKGSRSVPWSCPSSTSGWSYSNFVCHSGSGANLRLPIRNRTAISFSSIIFLGRGKKMSDLSRAEHITRLEWPQMHVFDAYRPAAVWRWPLNCAGSPACGNTTMFQPEIVSLQELWVPASSLWADRTAEWYFTAPPEESK